MACRGDERVARGRRRWGSAGLGVVLALGAWTSAPGAVYAADDHSTPVHFVIDTNVNTDYYTPRGLHVENEGASFHFLALAILDLYKSSSDPFFSAASITAGAWNNIQTHHVGPKGPNGSIVSVSPYNEVDPILSLEVVVLKSWTLGATYVPFISPPNLFPGGAEHNMEFKIAYDDGDLLGPFALHPYVKPFWNFSGPSPVVLGRHGGWDFEIGMNPSVVLFKDSDLPLTVSSPSFMTVANSHWFGGEGGVGHVAPVLKLSVPFPKSVAPPVGFWSLYAGIEYSHIFNDPLFLAGKILSGRNDRDVWVATGGVNVFVP